MQADHEVVIGRHRVQADLVGRPHAAHAGKVIRQPAFDRGLLRVVDPPIHRERIGDDLAAGVLGELESAAVELRKAVEEAALRVERKGGKRGGGGGRESGGRGIPEQRLAEHRERNHRQLEQRGRPRTRTEHESAS